MYVCSSSYGEARALGFADQLNCRAVGSVRFPVWKNTIGREKVTGRELWGTDWRLDSIKALCIQIRFSNKSILKKE